MADDLRRAFEFMERGDIGGLHTERTRFGTLHSDPRYPRRWDSNYHAVDRLPEDVSADELEADVERAQAAARFGHRCMLFRDAATAERLAPAFVARGWEVDRGVVMAFRRPPEKRVDTSLAVEVDLESLRAARQANMPPWGEVETRNQMIDAKHGIAERVSVRCFAVLVDGEVASYTDLYQDGGIAQVEDVATSEQHRGRGYASAVVMKAVEEARAAGAELIFLVTDADGWPRELYDRLGFDAIGGYVKFRRSA
jgi:ribosomal protein S18 acetylase RimI-like enzyme